MDSEKKCFGCKVFLPLDRFADGDRVYSKCTTCRLSLMARHNVCTVCGIRAQFNVTGERVGVRCRAHKEVEMVDVIRKKCEVCKTKIPAFAMEGEKPRRCGDCKEVGMVDVVNKKCEVCKTKQPAFGMPDEKRGRRCVDCKEAGMVDVRNPRCEVCLTKRAAFATHGQKATRCADCKEAGMVDVDHLKCEVCKVKRPNFAVDGQNAKRCCDCKEAGMVDVVNPRCEQCQTKRPAFGMVGEKPRRCGDCREAWMVDVKSKMCELCKTKQPTFGMPDEKRARRCGDCRLPGMVNVVDKMCEECMTKRPAFAMESDAKARRCGDCRLPGMVDVVNKKCITFGCRKVATCAQPGVMPQYCVRHKQSGMMLNPRRKCQGNDEEDCKAFATHGITEPLHCEEHAHPDEYCLAERACTKCGAIDILNKDGVCVNVCSLVEKDALMKKRVKKHEEMIVGLLQEEIDVKNTVMEMWRDTVIDSGCTHARPDLLYHCGNHIVVVEVDEHQHKSYKSCGSTKEERMATENRRMYGIATIFGLPILFIRYNPDGYVSSNGKKGTMIASRRHRLLVKWVRRSIHDQNMRGIQVKYLFYDGFDESDGSCVQLTESSVV